jgi:hypothetical protein
MVVLVNEPAYGGSGGMIPVVSNHPRAADMLPHELGHQLANLGDEYESAYSGYPPCEAECPEPNLTNQTDPGSLKWALWLDADTPIPTPETPAYASSVGLFEGGRYQATGVFRPFQDCAMRTLGKPFCPVCREALVRSFYDRVRPIDRVEPEILPMLPICAQQTLRVFHPQTGDGSLRAMWEVDGVLSSTDSDSWELRADRLGPGTHRIQVRVTDQTPLVRSDPEGRLHAEHTWTVRIAGLEGCETPADDPGASTSTGGVRPESGCGCASGAGEDRRHRGLPWLIAWLLISGRWFRKADAVRRI